MPQLEELDHVGDLRVIVRHNDMVVIPDDVVVGILRDLRKICLDAQTRALERAMTRSGQWNRFQTLDKKRLRRAISREPMFYLDGARRGSLELDTIISAAAAWVLLNTLGETFKEAYKGSRLHKALLRALGRPMFATPPSAKLPIAADEATIVKRVTAKLADATPEMAQVLAATSASLVKDYIRDLKSLILGELSNRRQIGRQRFTVVEPPPRHDVILVILAAPSRRARVHLATRIDHKTLTAFDEAAQGERQRRH